MKKRLFLTTIMTIGLAGTYLFAQGLYFNLNTGYSLSTPTGNDFYSVTYGQNQTTEERVNTKLGTGLNFGGTIGFMFNSNLGLELGVNYLKSATASAFYNDLPDNESEESTISSSMLRLSPSLVLMADMVKLKPYARFGVTLGTGKISEGYYYSEVGYNEVYEAEYKGGLAFGVSGALGVLYGFSENLFFFAEVNTSNLTYSPKNGKLIKATENGIDLLGEMSTREKEIIFVERLIRGMDNPPNENQPREELKRTFPMGNYGFNFGVRFGL